MGLERVEPIVEMAPAAAARPGRVHRGQLFRKYFLLILALVCGALIISGGIGLYFAYQENKVALASLQREKAAGAAARIEQFVSQIEQQLAFAALPQLGAEGLEQRRIEFLKLLRVVPAVTDIAQIDARGREQLAVSRLAMDVAGGNRDRSQEPAFTNARPGQTWYGPVYFRKETEPYMSIAVRTGGDKGPVTVAEVNLKFIWDVVTRIRIGEKGKAYVVDSTGHLVADPDIGLVLRKTNLANLQQVKAALAPEADDSLAVLAKDPSGNAVLTAWAPIEPAREQASRGGPASELGWKVFVEQPVSEVFAALDATVLRTVLLIVAGLLFSALAALYLARSMVRPIRTLQEGAARIGAGDLEQKIDVRTGDELQALAEQFNRMSAQLRESYAGLERKVEERTAELRQSLDQQTATSEILKVISKSTTDVQPVLEAIVKSAAQLFPACNATIFMREGGLVHRRAMAGATVDARMMEESGRIYPVPFDPQVSSSARAMAERRPNACQDTEAPDVPEYIRRAGRAARFRSNVVVPLVRDDEGIGTIALTHPEPGYSLTDKQLALLQTFADQAVIAIENVRLFNETKESLEQQTATSEILGVISKSTTEVQPVLDAIVRSAANLFPQCNAFIFMRDGDRVHLRAMHGVTLDEPLREELLRIYPVPFDPSVSTSARAMAERRINACGDTEAPDVADHIRRAGRAARFRSNIVVPLVREDEGIGTIVLTYPEPGSTLSEKEVALLRTFADQAVIAIENVRLFNETKESLERQTASADILRVISSTPTDVQPVFEAIVEATHRLIAGKNAVILLRRGDHFEAVASSAGDLAGLPEGVRRVLLDREKNFPSRAILDGTVVHVPDWDAVDVPEFEKEVAKAYGISSGIIVPLLRKGEGIGALAVAREPKGPYHEKEIALLQSFADQAVIAIENVRLFNETKESLEQQTAISEVLRVISSSPSDVHPVFEAVAQRAARICDARIVDIIVPEGTDKIRVAATYGPLGRPTTAVARDRTTVMGRSIVDKATVHIADLQNAGDEFPLGQELARKFGHRTILAVPLVSGEKALGTILLRRAEVRPFEEKHIALLKTFADQAAIAIENVRLFNETKEALEQQTATAEVLSVISGSITDARPVFDAISRGVLKLYNARSVSLCVRVGERIDRVGYALADKSADDGSQELWPIPLDDKSFTGRTILGGELVHIKDVDTEPGISEHSRAITRRTGVRSVLLAPMHSMGATTGALSVARRAPGGFSEREVELIRTFADQAVIAMENVRLFREIQEKSAQLEVANKHKSEFLANMSHELRTPLNAIIGFSEVLIERMFGEVNPKQADYLKDIHESGRHLLSLINDILDLSKIEAGRMDLELSTFDLPAALSNAMTLVRERAQRHGIELTLKVDKKLGAFQADERKLKQIVVNLLSNAVKFTPDGGRVSVSAKKDTTYVEIAVKDTGIGIAPEDQAAVFEEFKQVGRDYTKKAEGTGLGLALTKRFVELHGGEVRLESALGKGSTFTITLPLR